MSDPPHWTREELLALMIEQTRFHALVLLDPTGRIIHWLGAAEAMFGYTEAEIIGQPASRLFTPEEVALGLDDHEIHMARVSTKALDDRWLMRKDGSRFWASAVLVPLRDEHEQVVAFAKVVRDATDVKSMIETLENRIETLTEQAERREQFLGIFSHEIRNQLHPLRLAIHLIRETLVDLPENLQEYLDQVEQQIKNTQRLMDDLLDVTRISGGALQLKREEIDLSAALQRSVETCRPLAEQRRQELVLLVPPSTIIIEGDPVRLQQIFVNLINNAIKYTPDEGHIWIKVDLQRGQSTIKFEDTGVGIEPAMLSEIFELFTQEASAAQAATEGVGIGLWLVRNLVALHNGSISVRSEGKGRGSEFMINLPYKTALPPGGQTPPPGSQKP